MGIHDSTTKRSPVTVSIFRVLLTTFACLSLLASVTCGKDSPTKPKPPAPPPTPPPVQPVPTRITITPASATLMSIGETVQLAARVLDQNGQPVAGAVVTWQSSDQEVASVSSSGLVTAVMNGTAQITATAGSASARAEVRVMQSAGSIVITPEMATLMSIGETVQLAARVLDQNGQPVAGAVVTWQSSDLEVASVSSSGLVTAVGNGTAQITATAGSASASAEVRVMQSAVSIVITPEMATLMLIGETVQLAATVLDQNGQPVAGAVVSWQSSEETVATVTPQGLVTAVMNGTAQITATAGSASARAEVRVMQTAGSILITPEMATLMSIGETVQLTASVLDQNGQPVVGAVVTWQSNEETVATVSSSGLVTAVMNGTAQITATAGSASASAEVRVMQSAGSIVITPEMATLMSIGETVQLAARVLDQNGQPVAGAVVTWQSSDQEVASVSSSGLVTAVMNGTAQITATAGSASARAEVRVMQTAGSILITPEMATLMSIGETVQLTASVLDQNGQPVAGAVVTWQSNEETVATVSSSGLVTAVMNGTAQITATTGSASASAEVRVMQTAGSIVITPASATLMSIGETVQLAARVLDQNGQPVAGAVVTWQSSDQTVATVSSSGLVTAVRNGTATVIARAGIASATANITVMGPNPDREVLIAFYNATSGVEWTNSRNWLSEAPLGAWHGVTTNVNEEVIHLNLKNNNLQGTIPPELEQLSNLKSLVLSGNTFTGVIPPELGQLGQLTALWLVKNQLEGAIPPELKRLNNLVILALSNNHLTGAIPPELGQLNNLKSLFLNGNQLTGNIPSEIGNLQNLTYYLNLGHNQLTGAIPPELGQLSMLKALHLGPNPMLSGPLPNSFTSLDALEQLYLSRTQLCVPREAAFQMWLDRISTTVGIHFCSDPERDVLIALFNSTNGVEWTNNTNWLNFAPLGDWYGVTTDARGKVTKIVLADNNLSGSLPSQLSSLANLNTLNLSFNTALSGTLPHGFTRLSLEELVLEGTGLCAPSDSDFQEWLSGIPHPAVSSCTDTRRDFYTLAVLYNSMDGAEWTASTNWLSDAPLRTWYGVTANVDEEVTHLDLGNNNLKGTIPFELGQLDSLARLDLSSNQLSGAIPPELGQLEKLVRLDLSSNLLEGAIPPELGQLDSLARLDLSFNQLSGGIPAELGQLEKLSELYLSNNPLMGVIPPELGQLEKLTELRLRYNLLEGVIPLELGQLEKLTELRLSFNLLEGVIPPELGQLGQLTVLSLSYNQLMGVIPPELGQLNNLTYLGLNTNQLEGAIPPELGQLDNLVRLDLSSNQLEGAIPPELGQLDNLVRLDLSSNQLEGAIPPELGQLNNLTFLGLNTNQLTGTIPPELGQLSKLEELRLSFNLLTGNIPHTLGDLPNLKLMALTDNTHMSGALTLAFIILNLEELLLGGTGLCAPLVSEFQDWLRAIPNSRVALCEPVVGGSTVYLTQATQSMKHPVPLVAGEDALLRVFITTKSDVDVYFPPVQATFYQGGIEVYSVVVPGQSTSIPQRVDEGDLSASANSRVPGSVVMPGLEMVVEIDPDGTLDPALGIGGRLPPAGRTSLDVRSVAPFDLTLVPILWTKNPDRSILTQTAGLTAESDLFRFTRDLLPINDFQLEIREPLWSSFDPDFSNRGFLQHELDAIRTMDAATGHYMGVIRSGGSAPVPGFLSLSSLQGHIIAHELGHNMSLTHAPCEVFYDDFDPHYPYANGSIGVWGYDFLDVTLVNPETADLMSYCVPVWISDYSFKKALEYRQSQEAHQTAANVPSTRGLLLWGGVSENGALLLEPAFVVDAPMSLPQLDGPYRLTGEDAEGNTLFTLPFGMAEIADGGGGSFAFILPVQRDWATRLNSITLSGPEGVSSLDGKDDPSAALLLDSVTGKVRGILRDWPETGVTEASARRVLPEPGLEVVISRGVPEAADWD